MKSVNCVYEKDNLCHHGNLQASASKLFCNDADTIAHNKCKYRKKRPRKVRK